MLTLWSQAVAQSRPDLDSLVYGQPQQTAPQQISPQPTAPPQPVYAPTRPGLFTSGPSSAAPSGALSSSSGGAFAAMRNGIASTRGMFSSSRTSAAASRSYSPPPQRELFGNSGGAFAAMRAGFARPRRAYSPVAVVYAPPPIPIPAYDSDYRLDAGDRMRVVVYGQEGLTNSYAMDAGGAITMPLIGAVSGRGMTPGDLAGAITGKLRNGFIREPSVSVEIESYRPFFILGEVAAPGQYPYVPNMTAESAVAIAGGFSPRAKRDRVTLTHTDERGPVRVIVPPGVPINPGDTILVGERWF